MQTSLPDADEAHEPAPGGEAARDRIVEAEQTRLLYSNGPHGIALNLLVALLLAWLLADGVPQHAARGWLAAAVTVAAARAWLVYRYHQSAPGPAETGIWRERFLLGAGASGVLWGATAVLFLPHIGLGPQITVGCVLAGVAAGSISLLGPVYRAAALYVLATLVPPIAWYFLQFRVESLVMGSLGVLFCVAFLLTARRRHGELTRLLAFALDNERLVVDLSGANRSAEVTNRALEREIAAGRRAEADLAREKERAEVTLASIGDGIVTTGLDGVIDYMNPVAEHLTGWSAGDALGRPLADVLRLVDERTGELPPDPVAASLRPGGGAVHVYDVVVANERGPRPSVQVSVSPIRLRAGGTVGAVVVVHDITEQRALARELVRRSTRERRTGPSDRRTPSRRTAPGRDRTPPRLRLVRGEPPPENPS